MYVAKGSDDGAQRERQSVGAVKAAEAGEVKFLVLKEA